MTILDYNFSHETGGIMKDREFIIKELFNGWNFNDIINEEIALTFCEEELEVPCEYIDMLECQDRAIKLLLRRDRSYWRDDWYVNLKREAS